jgi:hypothetical protein
MGRIFGILFIMVAIWVGVEVYTEGLAGAFGGTFVEVGLVEPEEALDAPVTERAGRAMSRAYEASIDRVERQIDE